MQDINSRFYVQLCRVVDKAVMRNYFFDFSQRSFFLNSRFSQKNISVSKIRSEFSHTYSIYHYPIVPDIDLIETAIQHFNYFSCLQWIPKEYHHTQYVSFDPATTLVQLYTTCFQLVLRDVSETSFEDCERDNKNQKKISL